MRDLEDRHFEREGPKGGAEAGSEHYAKSKWDDLAGRGREQRVL
jgi:hypothetical protein